MKHLLSLEKLPRADFEIILRDAKTFKQTRGAHKTQPLAGQTWAMMFSKSSTRTRVSFEVGIRELGGSPMFLNANDSQLGRGELIQDTARVIVTPAIQEKFFGAGVETVGSSPEAFAALIRTDVEKMGKLIRDAGIRS